MSAEPAAKPSASTSVRTSRIECSLNTDSRLLASFGAIMAHAALRAGLPEAARDDVASAAHDAALEMASSGDGAASAATTKLVVDEFPDRLEVTIDSPAGIESDRIAKRFEGKLSDRVQCESRDGRVRITLVKPCGAAKSGSVS
jgi:hypothetical protein